MENAGSWWGEATLPEDREEINLRREKTNEKIDKQPFNDDDICKNK